MTDSNIKNVSALPGTFLDAVNKAAEKNPTKAIIIFAHDHPDDNGLESISIQFTSGIDFKDWATALLSLELFIKREYF